MHPRNRSILLLASLAPWEALDIEGITWTTALRADVCTRDSGGSGLVSQLIDPITGDHFTQGTIASRGVYNATGWASTGKPTVTFDGDLTQYIGTPSAASGKHFVIAVVKALSVPTARWYFYDSQDSNLIFTLSQNNSPWDIGYWNSPTWYDSGDTVVQDAETIIAWEAKAGEGVDIYQDAVQIANNLAYTNRAISGNIGLGANDTNDNYHCHMELAEVLVGKGDSGAGNDELSAAQKAALNSYLSGRYGLEAFA